LQGGKPRNFPEKLGRAVGNGPDGFLFFAQDIIIDIHVTGQLDDKVDVVSFKEIIVITGHKQTIAFCLNDSRGIGFQVSNGNNFGIYFLKFMPLCDLDQSFTPAPSADNGDVHFTAPFVFPIRAFLILEVGCL
jgi:hypothetical protein